jgi:2-polyprenyl-6-methoxyphenol hydroxylase-like FAD-dependent oxidoreductase
MNIYSRYELNKYLLSAAEEAGARVLFGHSVENMDFEKKEVTFSHKGKSVTHKVGMIFGADGGGSQTRRAMRANKLMDFKEEVLPMAYKEIMFTKVCAHQKY